jgi:endo-1,4-beta-xylanase
MSRSCLTGAAERIKQHRFTEAVLHIRKSDGSPLNDAEITVEQTAHAFEFGTTGAHILPHVIQLKGWTPDQVDEIKTRIKELFNNVTLPFYWGRFEPEEGRPHTEALRATSRWYKENGFSVKGHTLCWHTVCADWLMKYSNREIFEKQRERIRREMTDFKGLVDTWDVINELVIMPEFDKYDNAITRIAREYGRNHLADAFYKEARAADPGAGLILNEFILNKRFEDLVEALLEQGVPIDILGIQTHQHQGYRGAETIWDYAERFSRFNLPLHFSENTLVSGDIMPGHIVDLNDYKRTEWPSTPEGEERQCREAVEIYTLLYSHPAVQSITWWDVADGGWLNAPSGLLHRDVSKKPVFDVMKKLIKGEWWTEKRQLKTGPDGTVRLHGALGRYTLQAADTIRSFSLEKDVSNIDIRF